MSERQTLMSLRVRHSSMPASEVEAAIGQAAKIKWSVGDDRVAPNGRPIGGVRDETYCVFDVPEADRLALNAAILALGSRMAARSADLSELVRQGASIEIYATADEAKRGEMIDAAAIAALARLNAGLAIDWCK